MNSYALLERQLRNQQAQQQEEGASYGAWAHAPAMMSHDSSSIERRLSILSELSSNYLCDAHSTYTDGGGGVADYLSASGNRLPWRRSPMTSRRTSRGSLESIDTDLDVSGTVKYCESVCTQFPINGITCTMSVDDHCKYRCCKQTSHERTHRSVSADIGTLTAYSLAAYDIASCELRIRSILLQRLCCC